MFTILYDTGGGWREGSYSPPYHSTLPSFPLVFKDVVYNVNISEPASDQATKYLCLNTGSTWLD